MAGRRKYFSNISVFSSELMILQVIIYTVTLGCWDGDHVFVVGSVDIFLRAAAVWYERSRDVNILERLCQHGRTALFQMRSNPPSLSLHTNTSQCLSTSQEYEPLQNNGNPSWRNQLIVRKFSRSFMSCISVRKIHFWPMLRKTNPIFPFHQIIGRVIRCFLSNKFDLHKALSSDPIEQKKEQGQNARAGKRWKISS